MSETWVAGLDLPPLAASMRAQRPGQHPPGTMRAVAFEDHDAPVGALDQGRLAIARHQNRPRLETRDLLLGDPRGIGGIADPVFPELQQPDKPGDRENRGQ